jgi:hypothetical protein
MLFPIFIRKNLRSLDIKWIFLVLIVFAITVLFFNCQLEKSCQRKPKVHFVKLDDSVMIESNQVESRLDNDDYIVRYNRNLPIIFIGGVPRSGRVKHF